MIVGFIGGTGPAGIGLATRLALAGHRIAIGSRSVERAEDARRTVVERAPDADVRAGLNADIVRASEVLFLTVPPEGHRAAVEALPHEVDGHILVNMTTSVRVRDGRALFRPPPAGSMGEEVAEIVPRARVVTAFYEIHVRKLAAVDKPIEADTIVCGDDNDAKKVVMDLARAVEGLRAIDGGPLTNSRYVEGFVAVLIAINFRYKAASSYRITGIR